LPQNSAEQLSEVIVTCRGIVDSSADPTNPSQWLLTFRDQVDVIRPTMGGAADKLTCQKLEIAFGEKFVENGLTSNTMSNSDKNDTKNSLSRFNSFEPLQVKATGSPVIAASPSTKNFQAVGNEITLDLVRNELSLLGDNSIFLLYDQFTITGKSLYYAYERNGGMGKLDIPGAGTLEGRVGNTDPKTLKLAWSDQLKVLPDKNNPALTLVQIQGLPKVQVQGIGSAAADEIFLWCDTNKKNQNASSANHALPDGNNMDLDLKTILMQKRVLLKTENGECTTNELKITFQEPTTNVAARTATTATPIQYATHDPNPQQTTRTTVTNTSANNTSANARLSQLSIFGNGTDQNKSSYGIYADRIENACVNGWQGNADQSNHSDEKRQIGRASGCGCCRRTDSSFRCESSHPQSQLA
jgi:hypothetical protein